MNAFQLQLSDRQPIEKHDHHIFEEREARRDESNQQGKIERDYEPEQSYGTAHDFKEHVRFGGTREDY